MRLNGAAQMRLVFLNRMLVGDLNAAGIANRREAVREADIIVVMHEGRIVELGTHEALMARRGRFYELATARLAFTL